MRNISCALQTKPKNRIENFFFSSYSVFPFVRNEVQNQFTNVTDNDNRSSFYLFIYFHVFVCASIRRVRHRLHLLIKLFTFSVLLSLFVSLFSLISVKLMTTERCTNELTQYDYHWCDKGNMASHESGSSSNVSLSLMFLVSFYILPLNQKKKVKKSFG